MAACVLIWRVSPLLLKSRFGELLRVQAGKAIKSARVSSISRTISGTLLKVLRADELQR